MKSFSGSVHGKEEDPGRAFVAVSPDPRWPHLHRWSQGSPSVKSLPQGSVCTLAAGPSSVQSPRIESSPPSSRTPPADSPRLGASMDDSSSLRLTDLLSKPNLNAPVLNKSPSPAVEVMGETSITGGVASKAALAPDSSNGEPPSSTVQARLVVGDLPNDTTVVASEALAAKSLLRPASSSLISFVNSEQSPGLIAPVMPPLRGAWAKKLITPASFASHQAGRGGPSFHSKPCPVESSNEDDLRFPWAAKMDSAARNLYRATTPEYLEDGTPKVTIPSHVLLQGLENQKEYIIGQFYRCSPPSGGLVHAVVNRIWGRKCRIVSRKLDDSKFLFHIPDASTRAWVLQRGLWHVDDCLMFVAPWSTAETLDIPEISTIPVWVTLKNIPHRLYSIPGISHIASGLGAPMATYKPRLDPTLMGEAKILVEVELSKAFPPRIAAVDKKGNMFMVNVEYSWVPTTCGDCGQLGHKASRCMKPKSLQRVTIPGSIKEVAPAIVESAVQVDTNADIVTSITPVFVEPEVSVDDTLDIDVAPSQPIDHCTGVVVCHTDVVDDVVTDNIPNVGIAEDIAEPKDNVCLTEREESFVLAGNRFSRLGSSFSDGHLTSSDEESLSEESDNELDVMASLTPSGQRMLRERPVQPSIKAKEVQASTIARGRGYRGRGNRGRRGRGNGGRG